MLPKLHEQLASRIAIGINGKCKLDYIGVFHAGFQFFSYIIFKFFQRHITYLA